jgi:hypothetical protein
LGYFLPLGAIINLPSGLFLLYQKKWAIFIFKIFGFAKNEKLGKPKYEFGCKKIREEHQKESFTQK